MGIYFDHAAATPMRESAREAWLQAASVAANPSSIHGAGQAARRVLEDARERIAQALGADPIEVVLTSGGTESINLALKGMWWSRSADTSAIVLPDGEHHAVLDTVQWLVAHERAAVLPVGLGPTGRIDIAQFGESLAASPALATAIVANNEVGTINDVAALSAAASERGIPLHLDAVAALGHVPLSFGALQHSRRDALTMSLSAHKIGGPPATGALLVSRAARLTALQHGGASQRDLRAGTQDVAGAAGFAAALEEALGEREEVEQRVATLRDQLLQRLCAAVPQARVLGDLEHRLAGNAHLLFPGAPGESMLYLLDRAGIAVSTGSACQAGIAEPSHVVQAMGFTEAQARSVLRISLGAQTTQHDVDALIEAIPHAYGLASAGRS